MSRPDHKKHLGLSEQVALLTEQVDALQAKVAKQAKALKALEESGKAADKTTKEGK